MALYPTQFQQDAVLQVTTALGDNNLTTSTNAIDLGAATPFPATGRFTVQIATTAGNGVNTKNVNITLQDSAVNLAANFTNVTAFAPLTIAAANLSFPVTTLNIVLQPSSKRYIRILCITENAGGNPTNGTATLKLLF